MLIKIAPEFQLRARIPICINIGLDSNIWKDKVRIPICIKMGVDLQYLEGYDNNSNAFTNRARIQLFEKIRSENQCV